MVATPGEKEVKKGENSYGIFNFINNFNSYHSLFLVYYKLLDEIKNNKLSVFVELNPTSLS